MRTPVATDHDVRNDLGMRTAATISYWFTNLHIGTETTTYLLLLPIIPILLWCWFRRRKHKRWYFWPLPLVLPVLLIAAASAVNVYFGLYNRLGDLFDDYPFPTASASTLKATDGRYPKGVSVETDIEGTQSKVGPHPAFIWLPPQYFSEPTMKFPVIYLIAGSPGTFTDWSLGGNAPWTGLHTAEAGKPSIIVSVSVSSGELDDTECVNGAQGNWQTYLTVDVPNYVNGSARTLTGPHNQAMAGLSMGGYCAQVAALRNPDKFGLFGNFSGTTMPTFSSMSDLFGPVPNLPKTVESYSSDSIIESQPASRTVSGQVLVGSDDDPALIADEQQFVKKAKSYGMKVQFNDSMPGEHSFYFWSSAFKEWLPWALDQMGKPAP